MLGVRSGKVKTPRIDTRRSQAPETSGWRASPPVTTRGGVLCCYPH
jgi:hypothetical protein